MHSSSSYMSGRPTAASGAMSYGMAPPLPPPHLQQGGDSGASAPQPYGSHQMGHYAASQMNSGFSYPSQGFYGQPSQHPGDVAAHQQSGYYSHHPSQQQQQMEPNGQLYNAHQMNHPDMMSNGQYQGHHQSDVMNHQQSYTAMQDAAARAKRKQVKNACINCQKACKKCDEGRPCGRCVKYGLVDTCQDSARKERRRGIKRGPYKRRATTGSQPANSSSNLSSMPGYDRDGHISPTSRSDGMIGTPGANESSFSSPAFGSQALAPRPPMPLHMSDNQWQNGASQMTDDRESMRSRYGQPGGQSSYYGYDQQPAHHGYDRSSSAPINQQGSMLSPVGRFPNSSTPQSQPSQLPSLMSSNSSAYMGGSIYGNGNNARLGNGSTSSLVSPPLHSPATGSSFLSASSAPNGIAHHRLHSDSSLATLSSNGASSSNMSPRTPLNGPDHALVSPSGNKMSGGFTPPQPTVQSVSGTFLQQDANRPFPLKMPKAPTRDRSGTGNSYVDQHYGSNNLAPISAKRETSPHYFGRSNPYPNIQGFDDRRMQFTSPGMMPLRNEKDAGPPPVLPAGSLELA